MMPLLPPSARVMAWVKGFAAFKRNVSVAYAWEPVIVKAARKPVVVAVDELCAALANLQRARGG